MRAKQPLSRGLDPLIQRNFFTLMETLNKRGTTIFMSTHVLTEVERMCHEVGIIRAGELLVVDAVTKNFSLSRGREGLSTG